MASSLMRSTFSITRVPLGNTFCFRLIGRTLRIEKYSFFDKRVEYITFKRKITARSAGGPLSIRVYTPATDIYGVKDLLLGLRHGPEVSPVSPGQVVEHGLNQELRLVCQLY